MGLKIVDVKIIALCSKHRGKEEPAKNKDGKIYQDNELGCLECELPKVENELKGKNIDIIYKSNHEIGCELEGFVVVLETRGFENEANQLIEIASKLK